MRVYLYVTPGADREEMQRWVRCARCLYRQQSGDTLGDRMRGAFTDVFKGGAQRAVIIGTDVPELEMPRLRDAFAFLEEVEVVIGPSTDGGYYLLGVRGVDGGTRAGRS